MAKSLFGCELFYNEERDGRSADKRVCDSPARRLGEQSFTLATDMVDTSGEFQMMTPELLKLMLGAILIISAFRIFSKKH